MNFDLDTPLFSFTDGDRKIHWTIRNAVEGVQILGGIGSGKSTGSGRTLALRYLSHGFGGIVLTAKPDEKNTWVEYCRQAGRLDDLIIVEPGIHGKHSFNFLHYQSTKNSGKSYTDNLVHLLKTVIRAGDQQNNGRGDDKFWDEALDMLIANMIDLCLIANGKVSIQRLYDIMQSIMDDSEESEFTKTLNLAEQRIADSMQQWAIENGRAYVDSLEESYRDELLQELPVLTQAYLREGRLRDPGFTVADAATLAERDLFERIGEGYLKSLRNEVYNKSLYTRVPEARTFDLLRRFFLITFRQLNSRTRSIIEFSFSGLLFRLLREPVYSLFCSNPSTFTPEDCLEGKIIIINLPVKLYHKAGRDVQIMMKYIWQLAMEQRNIAANDRPVFCWADEAQLFLHEHDSEHQATARSSRIATVYISQNIPNYYARMGGDQSKYLVDSLLGTLSTRIMHANSDTTTNKANSELIGQSYMLEETQTISTAEKQSSSAIAKKPMLSQTVRPEEFVLLKNGGPRNNFKVGAYIHVQGKEFSNGFAHRYILFDQKFSLR